MPATSSGSAARADRRADPIRAVAGEQSGNVPPGHDGRVGGGDAGRARGPLLARRRSRRWRSSAPRPRGPRGSDTAGVRRVSRAALARVAEGLHLLAVPTPEFVQQLGRELGSPRPGPAAAHDLPVRGARLEHLERQDPRALGQVEVERVARAIDRPDRIRARSSKRMIAVGALRRLQAPTLPDQPPYGTRAGRAPRSPPRSASTAAAAAASPSSGNGRRRRSRRGRRGRCRSPGCRPFRGVPRSFGAAFVLPRCGRKWMRSGSRWVFR